MSFCTYLGLFSSLSVAIPRGKKIEVCHVIYHIEICKYLKMFTYFNSPECM